MSEAAVSPEWLDAAEAREPPVRRPGGIIGLLHAEIRRNPANPRRHFDAQDLEDLATSIAVDGLLKNLNVREPDANGVHMLIAGERRWRAIGIAIERGEWPADRVIPCLVKKVGDAQAAIIAIVENLAHAQLAPLEEAEAFQALRLLHQMGTEEIARRVHKTQRFVQQRLQLLELPIADRQALANGELTIEAARRQLARAASGAPSPVRAPSTAASPSQPEARGGDSASHPDAERGAPGHTQLFDEGRTAFEGARADALKALIGAPRPEPSPAASVFFRPEAVTLRLETGAASLAKIEVFAEGEVWRGCYGARAGNHHISGPLGSHAGRQAAIDEATAIIERHAVRAVEERDGLATARSRAEGRKILKWLETVPPQIAAFDADTPRRVALAAVEARLADVRGAESLLQVWRSTTDATAFLELVLAALKPGGEA